MRNKNKLPTEQEMLRYIPKKTSIDWEERQGLIILKIKKFESKIGKAFCKLIRRENYFERNLREVGSTVWKNCDGKKTVEDILKILKKEYPNEKNISNRLYYYLQLLNNLGYIELQ